MTKYLSRIAAPTGLLYLFLLVTQIIWMFYAARGIELPPAFTILHRLGFFWIIGWWLQRDSREHGFSWVYDLGLFLYIAWPFILLYYLFKTRGWKGFIPILAVAGIYLGTYLIGLALYLWFNI